MFPAPSRVSRSSFSRDPPLPTLPLAPHSPSFTPFQLGSLVAAEAFSPLPAPESGDIPGLSARWKPHRILSRRPRRGRGAPPHSGGRRGPGGLPSPPPPGAQPPGCPPRGPRGSPEPGHGAWLLGREAPAKFPPEPAAGGGGREGGAGTGRPDGGESPRAGEMPPRPPPPGASRSHAPSRFALARSRRHGPALGPQKGRRARRRRRRRTYRARLARAAGSLPGSSRRVRPSRAHTAPGQIQRSRARGRGAPPRERGAGAGGAGAGRGRECYNFLPCPPPAARPRDAGGEGAGAPMSSLSFSPPRSPSPRPPALPASSKAADQAGPEFSGLGPRTGGPGRRGRRKARRAR